MILSSIIRIFFSRENVPTYLVKNSPVQSFLRLIPIFLILFLSSPLIFQSCKSKSENPKDELIETENLPQEHESSVEVSPSEQELSSEPYHEIPAEAPVIKEEVITETNITLAKSHEYTASDEQGAYLTDEEMSEIYELYSKIQKDKKNAIASIENSTTKINTEQQSLEIPSSIKPDTKPGIETGNNTIDSNLSENKIEKDTPTDKTLDNKAVEVISPAIPKEKKTKKQTEEKIDKIDTISTHQTTPLFVINGVTIDPAKNFQEIKISDIKSISKVKDVNSTPLRTEKAIENISTSAEQSFNDTEIVAKSNFSKESYPDDSEQIENIPSEFIRLYDSHEPSRNINLALYTTTSLVKRAELLYIIDGTPIETITHYAAILKEANPSDIESIFFIKGSSAYSLYGNKAVNGVVLINTKSGNALFKIIKNTEKKYSKKTEQNSTPNLEIPLVKA